MSQSDDPLISSSAPESRQTRVVVATSIMLSFISFWRAAAIVLADIGSSAFYCGGIAEQAVGYAAPWFILGVMLFSYAVRAVYVESCTLFTRGGVYRVVKEAMGGTMAKLSVSALMFDYILTGPISGVSAGQYVVGLVAQTLTSLGHPWYPTKATTNLLAAVLAVAVTVYFWRRNTRGIHESSTDALRIMAITTVMVVLLVAWSALTVMTRPEARRLPPAPTPAHLSFHQEGIGWLPRLLPGAFEPMQAAPGRAPGSRYRIAEGAGSLLGLIGILIAFGHSILAMSGEETLAQVNRELEHPKHKNLMRAGLVIFVYSLVFTSLVSFLAYAIVPDAERPRYYDNLISGIAVHLVGPSSLRLLFQAFIVLVGFLLLSGAVNTSIIGSNAVLNRVSEDGVLTSWFRKPHRRYGTTYRTVNLIAGMQIATIVLSRGNVYLLGEAYAFGVVWSFFFNALSMYVLRFRDRTPREWKVPGNPTVFGVEIPVGLGTVALALLALAGVNLFTKRVATVSGLAITAVFSTVFFVSERINARSTSRRHGLDEFNLLPRETIEPDVVGARPGSTLCPVRDYNNLEHLRRALDLTHTAKRDMVVMTVHPLRGPHGGYRDLGEERLFTDYEQTLFTRVVALAERAGKGVNLMVVPSTDPIQAIVQSAAQLFSAEIVVGASPVMSPKEQALRFGEAWERLAHRPRHMVRLRILGPAERIHEFTLGAHAPRLTSRDIQLIHELWVKVKDELPRAGVRHRDVVTLAIRRLERELGGMHREAILVEMQHLKAVERPEDLHAPPAPPPLADAPARGQGGTAGG